jgi:hypothetical protein
VFCPMCASLGVTRGLCGCQFGPIVATLLPLPLVLFSPFMSLTNKPP